MKWMSLNELRERYLSFFSHSQSLNLVNNWRSPRFQNCRLYEGKFSPVFFDFCAQNIEHNLFCLMPGRVGSKAAIYITSKTKFLAQLKAGKVFDTDLLRPPLSGLFSQ